MKKTIGLLGLLILLGAVFFYLKKEDDPMSKMTEERRFKVDDYKKIDKIVIKQNDSTEFVFKKQKEDWFVNDTVLVWPPQARLLLGVLARLKVDYTPPKAMVSNMEQSFKDFGIEVYAYDKRNNELLSFILGGVTPGEDGSYAKRIGYDQPFVVVMPNRTGGVRSYFNFKMKDLKNRYLFKSEWDEVKRVSLDYPKAPNKSFVLENDKGQYKISRFQKEGSSDSYKISKGRAEAYLMNFELLGFEAFENEHTKRDSISSLAPYASMTVELMDGTNKWIKLYPYDGMIENINLSEEFLNKGDFFRYLAPVSTGDFILIQQNNIGKTLKSYEYFKSK